MDESIEHRLTKSSLIFFAFSSAVFGFAISSMVNRTPVVAIAVEMLCLYFQRSWKFSLSAISFSFDLSGSLIPRMVNRLSWVPGSDYRFFFSVQSSTKLLLSFASFSSEMEARSVQFACRPEEYWPSRPNLWWHGSTTSPFRSKMSHSN